MNLSSTSSPGGFENTAPTSSRKDKSTLFNETHDGSNSEMYESALENLSAYTSYHQESANNNSSIMNSTTDFDATLNSANLNGSGVNLRDLNTNINASVLLIQSESTDTNTSQEEVNPKSQLANKTIFKTDNPNLSIIEISNNSREQDIENSVVLIESSSDEEHDVRKPDANQSAERLKKSPSKLNSESAAEKRRKKAESLIHSSKQKLNVAIAEASAAESQSSANAATAAGAGGDGIGNLGIPQQLDTKREINMFETLEEFEKNLPSTVTVLDTPFGSKVYLVGTAHFSEESQDDVSFVIRNVRPDVVMVELCPSRIHILKLDEKTLLEEAKNINLAKIRSILQAHGYINGVFFILLLQLSAQIAKDLGMAPGGEFRRAFEEIHKLPGCILHLGDRPIRITLHRALRALSLWQTMKLVWRLTSADTISIEEVEECKQRDLLEKLMQEMAGEFPAFSDVFVKERDMYLCHSLQMAALPQMTNDCNGMPRPVRVVGVVGIGHAKGIAQMWGRVDPHKIPAIMEIPPASTSTRVCKYTIKYGLIGLTLFGVFKVLRPRLTRFF